MKKTSSMILSLCATVLFSAQANLKDSNNSNTTTLTSVEIAKFIMSNDGYLNEELHEKFWNDIGKNKNSLNEHKLSLLLRDMPHIQLMIWQSIRNSIVLGKKTFVPGLKEELVRLKSSLPNVLELAEQMIEDAATKQPHPFGEKQKIVFTIPMADSFIENWKLAEERGVALYDKNYEFETFPRRLTDDMTLDWEFSLKKQKAEMLYGKKKLEGEGFSTRVSKDKYIFVAEAIKQVVPDKENLKSCVQGFFNIMGNKNKIDIRSGDTTSFGLSSFQVKGTQDKVYSAVGCELRDNRLYAMVANSTNREDTARLFAKLAENLHIRKSRANEKN